MRYASLTDASLQSLLLRSGGAGSGDGGDRQSIAGLHAMDMADAYVGLWVAIIIYFILTN